MVDRKSIASIYFESANHIKLIIAFNGGPWPAGTEV